MTPDQSSKSRCSAETAKPLTGGSARSNDEPQEYRKIDRRRENPTGRDRVGWRLHVGQHERQDRGQAYQEYHGRHATAGCLRLVITDMAEAGRRQIGLKQDTERNNVNAPPEYGRQQLD